MKDVKEDLEQIGCVYQGHFVGTSGKHLSGYFNIDPVMSHTYAINEFAKIMVKPFKKDDVQTVVAPATGAIPFAHLGALHLIKMTNNPVQAVWADKTKVNGDKAFVFERTGFKEAVTGKNVLILEDMINQMFSVKKVIELVNQTGGNIVGVASVASNSSVSAEAMGVAKYHRLALIEYDAWTPDECVKKGLCSKNVPIVTDIGHGDEFELAHQDYPGGYVTLAEQKNSQ